jgi:hypothetical protein
MRILTTVGEILAPATAFATLGACEDSSGIIEWAFLVFCALMIVEQAIPAVLLLFRMQRELGL